MLVWQQCHLEQRAFRNQVHVHSTKKNQQWIVLILYLFYQGLERSQGNSQIGFLPQGFVHDYGVGNIVVWKVVHVEICQVFLERSLAWTHRHIHPDNSGP